MFFIDLTDAVTNKPMLIRGDLIARVEESERYRTIFFTDNTTEHVSESMEQLKQLFTNYVVVL